MESPNQLTCPYFLSTSYVSYTHDQAFNGYAARLDGKALDLVRKSEEVEAIFEDGIVILDSV